MRRLAALVMTLALWALALAADGDAILDRLAAKPKPWPLEPGSAKHICVIPIRDETGDINFYSLKRRFAEAARRNADLIVLDINSPGGPIGSSIRISNLIADHCKPDAKPPVVVYVSEWAISGGAMAALGCPTILMNKHAQIGASQPIMLTPGADSKIAPAPEKIVSPTRAVFRTHAEQNGYPVALCEAMVDPEIGVSRLEIKDGPPVYVTHREIEELKKSPFWERVTSEQVVNTPGKLLTLTAGEALRYGIARKLVDNENEVIRFFGAQGATVETLGFTRAETFIDFLNSSWLTGLLIFAGLAAAYFAFQTPGFGVPETIAIACFVLFFFAKFMVGKADVLEIALFGVGAALLAVEIFLIPGFGVIGVTGALMMLASLVLAFQDFTFPRYAFQWEDTVEGIGVVIGGCLAAIILAMTLIRFSPNTPLLRRFVLVQAVSNEQGYTAETQELRSLAGREGVTLTMLRPAGRADIGGEVLQVVTQGEWIDKDTPIKVIEVAGNRITVGRA